jgi:hypothetical protein
MAMHPMNAQPFHGHADHMIDDADDGEPLPGCRGWVCAACGALYAEMARAELCCMQPVADERRSRRNLFLAVIGGGLLLVILIEVLTVATLGKPASTSARGK